MIPADTVTVRNARKSHSKRSSSRHAHDDQHTGDLVAERAGHLLHEAIDNVTERLRNGNTAIVNGGRQLRSAADERIRDRPLTSVAVAFGAGMAAAALLHILRPRQ